MVTLFERDKKAENRKSSKGNQLKWLNEGIWYKADYTGYEGLAEYIISHLLEKSSLLKEQFVLYDTEVIQYGQVQYNGCKSPDFLTNGWNMITLERLFQNMYGQSLTKSIYAIQDHENRLKFLVDQTIRMTGLKDFGKYMCQLLTMDALFLNEDRHMHNIAVLMDDIGQFHYCPFFDHGAGLLSDTTMDYPAGMDVIQAMEKAQSKTFCTSFDEQLDIAEKLYGQQIRFAFSVNEVEELLMREQVYGQEMKDRVLQILILQRRKYRYLFQ